MAWCCLKTHDQVANHALESTVEIKVKEAYDATESWIAHNKLKRADNARLRTMNAEKRKKLEESRRELLENRGRTEEELVRLQNELNAIEGLFLKLEEAEAELERMVKELDSEEEEMMNREEVVKSHLTTITCLTGKSKENVVVEAVSPSTVGGMSGGRGGGGVSPCGVVKKDESVVKLMSGGVVL